MKTMFLKQMVPFVVVAVTGISGAFLTTSMQKVSAFTPKLGYINGPNGPCSVPVQCNTTPKEFCRASYPSGAQAKDKDSNCADVLYRP